MIKTYEMEEIAAVKKVRKWNKRIFLVSDNSDFVPEPTELDWNELCVGRVIWQWKDMRKGEEIKAECKPCMVYKT